MEQIIIENGIITHHIDALSLQNKAVAVFNFTGIVGSFADEYNADWSLKKLSERVKLGRVTIPTGNKLSDDGTTFIPLSQIERYISGVEDLPSGCRLSDDKTELVAMTISELLSAGTITVDEANERYIAAAKSQRESFFASYVDKVNAARWDAMSVENQAQVTTYRQALCDITKQAGYPTTIVWPDVPSILQ